MSSLIIIDTVSSFIDEEKVVLQVDQLQQEGQEQACP